MGLVERYTHSGSSKFSNLQSTLEPDFVQDVIVGRAMADSSMLAFRNPHHFLGGQLHKFLESWLAIASQTDCDTAKEIWVGLEMASMSSIIFSIFVGPSKEKILTVTCLFAKFFKLMYLVNCFPPSFLAVT